MWVHFSAGGARGYTAPRFEALTAAERTHVLSFVSDIRLRDSSWRPRINWSRENTSRRKTASACSTPRARTRPARRRARARQARRQGLLHGQPPAEPTNVCVLACKFCDYAKKPGDRRRTRCRRKTMLAHVDPEITEIHIVGGLHNKWRFDDYLNIIRWVKEKKPDLSVKAYTAVEIDFFCRLTKKPVDWVLTELKNAGSTRCPAAARGGCSASACAANCSARRSAASAGSRSTRPRTVSASRATRRCSTAHIESRGERVQHMIDLRELEMRAPGFFAFILLAFQPGNTGLVRRQASAIEDPQDDRDLAPRVRQRAAREGLLGHARAGHRGRALNFGASDLDGTIGLEDRARRVRAARSAWPKRAWSDDPRSGQDPRCSATRSTGWSASTPAGKSRRSP